MNARWLCCLLVLAVGCGPKPPQHHSQSELLPDGSIERVVLQPQGSILKRDEWDLVASIEKGRTFERFDGDLSTPVTPAQLASDDPVEGPLAKVEMVLARKIVKRGDQPPHSVEYRNEQLPDQVSSFRVERVINEYGLLTEFRWTETLTEVVDLVEARRARREFGELFMGRIELAAQQLFEPEYDATEVLKWLRTDGLESFEDLAQAWLQTSRDHRVDGRNAAFVKVADKILAEQCRKLQIEPVGFAKFMELPKEAQDEFATKFFARLLTQKLKRRDGKPVEERRVLEQFLDEKQQQPHARVDAAYEAAFDEFPGGRKAFNDRAERLAAKHFGIHGLADIFGRAEHFRCTVKMPGIVVETNGILIGDRDVQWKFQRNEAYPDGYAMQARSVVPNAAAISGLRADWPTNRRCWLRLIELVEADTELAESLRQCGKQKSLDPLEQLLQTAPQLETRDRARKLLSALKSKS